MKNLMDAIDECLMAQGYDPISGVINNKEKCVRYINRILESVDNKVVIPFGLLLTTSSEYGYRGSFMGAVAFYLMDNAGKA